MCAWCRGALGEYREGSMAGSRGTGGSVKVLVGIGGVKGHMCRGMLPREQFVEHDVVTLLQALVFCVLPDLRAASLAYTLH